MHNADFLTNCPEDRRLVLNENSYGNLEVICNYLGRSVPKGMKWPVNNKNGGIHDNIRYGNGLLITQIYTELKKSLFWLVLILILITVICLGVIFGRK